MAKAKRYCKNTVTGRKRGKKYPAELRAEVVMAMLTSNSICAVAKRYDVPESTIRSWLAEEARRGDVWAAERQAAAREIAMRAALGAKAQVGYLQERVAESQRAATICGRMSRRLDEDARARGVYGRENIGMLLKSEDEEIQDALETAMVVYDGKGTRDRALSERERDELQEQMERYAGRIMTDRDAASMAQVLMGITAAAAALSPDGPQKEDAGAPLIQIGAEMDDAGAAEVLVDG